MPLKITVFITALLLIQPTFSQPSTVDELPRRAKWQATLQLQDSAGLLVSKLEASSPLKQAGLQVGDRIVAIDAKAITSNPQRNDITDALVADRNYRITYRRGVDAHTADVRFAPVPLESYPNLTVTYSQITSNYGIRQRTIITRPNNKKGRQPAIFVVQGLSCSSIENTPGRKSNFIRSLTNLAKQSGMVMLRVEKPGLGDSEGDCSQTDFYTELDGYETALQQLLSLPYIDPKRVIVYGSSMGSALAPYLANKYQLNGIISDGTFYRSWFEHMLEIERRIKQMQDVSEADINQQMVDAYIPLYYGMLVEKKSYAQVIDENPLLSQYNYHLPEHMYGRPVSYYHQLQDFNVPAEWEKLIAPARIRWGTLDWIMSEADNHMIVDTLKRNGHRNFKFYKHPNMDHWDTLHKTAKDSFTGKAGTWNDDISQVLVNWAKELNGK
ncbi:PDZ domain-containing protein [Porticoccus sp. W117]|uniref:PDZ domain-containing protein n=1 Tax=Porticoccus sp. W117 TaxID=3054777 RepID=UPI002593332D|nr:PDZ domain-containing protein [Porticoccus sp. W117]MDM3870874.1 PDZ domain-containing protein [Porticoccus sp. W117]